MSTQPAARRRRRWRHRRPGRRPRAADDAPRRRRRVTRARGATTGSAARSAPPRSPGCPAVDEGADAFLARVPWATRSRATVGLGDRADLARHRLGRRCGGTASAADPRRAGAGHAHRRHRRSPAAGCSAGAARCARQSSRCCRATAPTTTRSGHTCAAASATRCTNAWSTRSSAASTPPTPTASASHAVPQLADLAAKGRSVLLATRVRRHAPRRRPGRSSTHPAAAWALWSTPLVGARRVAAATSELRHDGPSPTLAARRRRGGASTVEYADAVVLACPRRLGGAARRRTRPTQPTAARAIEYADVVLVTLAIPRRDWPERSHGSGYLVPKPVQRLVTAVSFASQKWAHWPPDDDGRSCASRSAATGCRCCTSRRRRARCRPPSPRSASTSASTRSTSRPRVRSATGRGVPAVPAQAPPPGRRHRRGAAHRAPGIAWPAPATTASASPPASARDKKLRPRCRAASAGPCDNGALWRRGSAHGHAGSAAGQQALSALVAACGGAAKAERTPTPAERRRPPRRRPRRAPRRAPVDHRDAVHHGGARPRRRPRPPPPTTAAPAVGRHAAATPVAPPPAERQRAAHADRHASRSRSSASTQPLFEGITLEHPRPRPRPLARHGRCPATRQRRSSPGTAPATTRPFRNIDQLVAGDEVVLTTDDGRFVYLVTEHRDRHARRDVDHRPDAGRTRPRCSPATRRARPVSASWCTSPAGRPTGHLSLSPACVGSLPGRGRGRRAGPACSSRCRCRRGASGRWRSSGIALFELSLGRHRRPARSVPRADGCSPSAGCARAWRGCGSSPRPATWSPRPMFAAFHAVAALRLRRRAVAVIGPPAAHTVAEASGSRAVRRRAARQPGHRPGAGPLLGVVRVGGVAAARRGGLPGRRSRSARPVALVPALDAAERTSRRPRRHRTASAVVVRRRWCVVVARSPLGAARSSTSASRCASPSCRAAGRRARRPPTPIRGRRSSATSRPPRPSSRQRRPRGVAREHHRRRPLLSRPAPSWTEVAAEADRLGAPFAVGITEDAGRPASTSERAGRRATRRRASVDRYDKVRRVPFGEYMPLRGCSTRSALPVD